MAAFNGAVSASEGGLVGVYGSQQTFEGRYDSASEEVEMSTVPPESVPPSNPLPWEVRETRGLVRSFFDTLGLFVTRPAEAWARVREGGDSTSPLLFGVAICWLSTAVQGILHRFIAVPVMPEFLQRRFGSNGGFGGAGLIVRLIVAPFVIAIGLFVGAAILHLCCMLVGALQNSRSGFEGTLRAVCYSEVSSIASIVPFVGGLIAIVWWIVLAVQGVERLHRTTSGKAVAAVLIPAIVCCGGAVLIALAVGAALFSRFGHH